MDYRKLDSRRLRQRLDIQTRDLTPDHTGQPSNVWTTAYTVWGAIEPLSGDELDLVASLQIKTTHRVTIRYLAGLTGRNQRICYEGRIFSIVSVRNYEERNRILEIYCEEGRMEA